MGPPHFPAALPKCLFNLIQEKWTLLPALPDEFKTGKIKGLKARGGYRIDMEWERGNLKKAEIYAGKDSPIRTVRLKNNPIDLKSSGTVISKRNSD